MTNQLTNNLLEDISNKNNELLLKAKVRFSSIKNMFNIKEKQYVLH
jgi:hypothetical protein